MAGELHLAITADLHWGHGGRGEEATRLLASFLHQTTPDVLVLAGDIGSGSYFGECLQLFADLPCRKALVPGNHDLWVRPDDTRDSLQLYTEDLAALCRQYGFHYLDQGPLLLPEAGLALVGSINWYDYSWSRAALERAYPGEEQRLFSNNSRAAGTTMSTSCAGRSTICVSRPGWSRRWPSICATPWCKSNAPSS